MISATKLVLFLIFWINISSAQITKCLGRYKLKFHTTTATFGVAKTYCESNDGNLVKVENKEITEEINRVIGNNEYYIGLQYQRGVWRWGDGTSVAGIGYSNWAPSEPNGANEFCVIVGQPSKQWVDVACDRSFYYICQTDEPLVITVSKPSLTITTTAVQTIRCESSACEEPLAGWYDKNTEIPLWSTGNKKVYQVKSGGTATLNIVADISTPSEYTCRAKSGSQTGQQISRITIDGTPTIGNVTPIACTTNLKVLWLPHVLAVGFPHSIKAYPKTDKSNVTLRIETPNTSSERETILEDLQPNTQYIVEIKPTAAQQHAWTATSTASTSGSVGPVVNATIIRQREKCVASWTPPNALSGEITRYEVVITETVAEFRNPSAKLCKIYTVNNPDLNFEHSPNRIYTVEVAAVTCFGKTIFIPATGQCRSNAQVPSNLSAPEFLGTSGDTADISIKKPDESNGLISCLFVIVTNMDDEFEYTEYSMQRLQNLTDTTYEYIAISIPVFRFNATKYRLGDEANTTCNAFDTGVSNSTSNVTIRGWNRKLDWSVQQSVMIVSVTPDGNNILLQKSPAIEIVRPIQSTTTTLPAETTEPTTSIVEITTTSPVVTENTQSWFEKIDFTIFIIAISIPVSLLILSIIVCCICKLRKEPENYSVESEDPPVQDIKYVDMTGLAELRGAAMPNLETETPSVSEVHGATLNYEEGMLTSADGYCNFIRSSSNKIDAVSSSYATINL